MKIDQGLVLKAIRFFSEKVGDVEDARVNFFFSPDSSLGFYDHISRQIFIDKTLTGRKLIVALFHELTHFFQAKRGDFKLGTNGVTYDNVFYSREDLAAKYWNLPWEVEARFVSEFWADRFLLTTN